MYLFVKDSTILGYAKNRRMALIGDVFVIDGQFSASPYSGAMAQYIPDQKIGWLYDNTPEGEMRVGLQYPGDVPILPTAEELQQQIDYETEWRIHLAIHSLAGEGEEIGILRDQMVQWGNKLGLEFTPDFTRLNEIAIAAVEDGAARKALL